MNHKYNIIFSAIMGLATGSGCKNDEEIYKRREEKNKKKQMKPIV